MIFSASIEISFSVYGRDYTQLPRLPLFPGDENVVFAYILWPDKTTRDKAWDQLMADPDMQPGADMPFDGKRMFWGGFVPEVTYGKD